jgi:hypothetical protein
MRRYLLDTKPAQDFNNNRNAYASGRTWSAAEATESGFARRSWVNCGRGSKGATREKKTSGGCGTACHGYCCGPTTRRRPWSTAAYSPN